MLVSAAHVVPWVTRVAWIAPLGTRYKARLS